MEAGKGYQVGERPKSNNVPVHINIKGEAAIRGPLALDVYRSDVIIIVISGIARQSLVIGIGRLAEPIDP